ncbi:hypothetical protein DFH27DRAFT_562263 [Peziza echinospora]|nr:hypothetical protein DFH27DRAFT_562263 [Peziza echinospora]
MASRCEVRGTRFTVPWSAWVGLGWVSRSPFLRFPWVLVGFFLFFSLSTVLSCILL